MNIPSLIRMQHQRNNFMKFEYSFVILLDSSCISRWNIMKLCLWLQGQCEKRVRNLKTGGQLIYISITTFTIDFVKTADE